MKKVFFILAFAGMTMAANAQLIVGGNLNLGFGNGTNETRQTAGNSTETTEWDAPKTLNFSIMPKVGYQLNDKMAFGLTFGFSYEKVTSTDIDNPNILLWKNYKQTIETTSNTISIAPWFRYNVTTFNNLTCFVEASVPFMITPAPKEVETTTYTRLIDNKNVTEEVETEGWKTFAFGVSVVPGLNYAFNDHLNLDVYFNAIGIAFNHVNMTRVRNDVLVNGDEFESTETTNDFGLGINLLPAAVSFGINYKF